MWTCLIEFGLRQVQLSRASKLSGMGITLSASELQAALALTEPQQLLAIAQRLKDSLFIRMRFISQRSTWLLM
jgi:hypothetical protein